MKKNRRQFLKNASLAFLALGTTPSILARSKNKAGDTNATCNALTEDFYGEGPFYTSDAPFFSNGIIAPENEPGTRLLVTGRIQTLDCTQVIPNTELDLWQANDAAEYDNEGFHLRGRVLSNSQGFYSFETIWPGKYLNFNTLRPRHIHVKITTPNNPEITTQLYFEGDTSIPDDPAASITSGPFDATHRIISLTNNGDVLEGTWDIVIDGEGILGTSDIHLTNGMIYSVSPNPFTDELNIYYGVFKPSNIKIEVYDLQGRLVASIKENHLTSDKYTATWRPQMELPSGVYFCTLKVNDLQVHYKKIIKK